MPLSLSFNEIYEPLFTTKARHIHFWGGRARGGSYTATQYFLHLMTEPAYFRGYIMREVLSDIRESLWLDLKDRIEEAELTHLFELEESKMICKYIPTGNTVVAKGFKKASKKQTAKLKSLAGATHVLVEEMEEINESDFKQLDDTLRTTKTQDIQLIGIFNPPPKGHWIWRKWYQMTDSPVTGYFQAVPRQEFTNSLLSIFSTYRDNEINLNSSFITNLNQYLKDDPEYYYTMVEGLISEGVRGRIFRNWTPCATMPGAYTKFYGLDWGFSGDPLALIEMETHNRSLWVDQKIYAHGMTNDDLHKELLRLKISRTALITADNAQPKDIEDMRRKGWNFVACVKGPGSVKSGIKFLKQYDIFVTEGSKAIWTEYENYAYALDQFKNPTDDPIDSFNHAIDGMNYGMDKVRIKKPTLRVI